MFPHVTSLYAAVFGLIFAALSMWVVAFRFHANILHGDGGQDRMQKRIRAHGNFAEYVPLILLLTALLEAGGASATAIHALLAPLLVARLLHPAGMLTPANSIQQYLLRAVPVVVTFLVLIAASVQLLLRIA